MVNQASLGYILRFYPFEEVDTIRQLPASHWFNRQFLYLTRTPTRNELNHSVPAPGLLDMVIVIDGDVAAVQAEVVHDAESVERQEERQGDMTGTCVGSCKPLEQSFCSRKANTLSFRNKMTADPCMNRTRAVNALMVVDNVTADTPVRRVTRSNDANHGQNAVINHSIVEHPAIMGNVEPIAERHDEEDNMLIDNDDHADEPNVFEGIYVPTNDAERRTLIQLFRDEVMLDEVRDLAAHIGFGRLFIADEDLEILEIAEAMEIRGRYTQLPEATVEDIRRHDWNRRGDCIYTLRVDGYAYRGNALSLQARLFGIRRALWQYWAHRPTVNAENVVFYVSNYGTNDFYRVIMWHMLAENQWLALWYARRASRRG
ncbi:hypothetical protein QFC19_003389 [Naganishia cerealis]|uniref:Uncharacterized protein n=1 Tax=Naganishia cerealis TaxID=610337 RepID=A0ACC2W4S5_9TREE|nr:hypothetical protein QFC19_003389 [Naganishia cerealis]